MIFRAKSPFNKVQLKNVYYFFAILSYGIYRIAETLIPLSLISMFITFAAFLVCICCPTCILNRLRQRRLRKGYKPKRNNITWIF